MQLLFSGAVSGPEEIRGVTAVLGVVDAESGEILHLCEYGTPSELRAPGQKMQFTGFCMADGGVYACTHTEIVRFDDWPPSRPAARISIPGFNDLHHCIPWDGGLAVANTGLETVDHVSLGGELLHRWDLLARHPEAPRRIDPDLVDYRQLADTKPHHLHGNHLWIRHGELWITELKARGAEPVSGGRLQVTFDAGRPHDGRYVGGRLVFTTVNGRIVLLDPDSLETLEQHYLRDMTPGARTLGWCRGVCEDPRAPNRYFVGFSSLRESRWHEYGFHLNNGHPRLRSRIVLYDVERREAVKTLLDAASRDLVLFQLTALPKALWLRRRESAARGPVTDRVPVAA
jgi:hypothetical protein